jgi:hypothetical protein
MNDEENPDCDVCWDTGLLPICWCSATSHPPCSGCEADPFEWAQEHPDETRACTDCDGPKEEGTSPTKIRCDCPVSVIFTAGCQNKEEHE